MKIIHTIKRSDILSEGKLVKPLVLAQLLSGRSNAKHSFSVGEVLYIYTESLGIYEKLSKDQFHQSILLFLVALDLSPYVTKNYVVETAWCLLTSHKRKDDLSYDYLTFKNGCLNLRKMELLPYSPELFSITRINSEYDPHVEPIEFQKLMDLNFEEDIQLFLKAFLRSALLGENQAQVFLYILGPGGTGKSTLVNIFTMVVGEGATLTTTFRDLNQDRFEGNNLVGKRLICINDTETFKGDLTVLKAITGGDSIQGREKHVSGSSEVRPRGLLIVTGNTPLQTRDVSGAISRRIRVINMDQKPSQGEIKPLLYKVGGEWRGPLVRESSGIVNWSYMESEKAYPLLVNPQLTPNLLKAQQEALEILNPLSLWIQDLHIDPAQKSYIGFVPAKIDLTNLINLVKFKKALYPSYLIFCHKRSIKPLSHIRFSSDLIMSCNSMDIPVERGKDKHGAFVKGLSVDIVKVEEIYGSPTIDTSELEEFNNSEPRPKSEGVTPQTTQTFKISSNSTPLNAQNSSKFDNYQPRPKSEGVTPQKSPRSKNSSKFAPLNALVWRTRNENLYKSYYEALGSDPIKVGLNKIAHKFNPDLEKLQKEYTGLLSGLKGIQVEGLDYDFGKPSKAYEDKNRDILSKGVLKIQKQLIPFKYKPMGLSPRILPQGYGDSFNSVKRFLREKAFKFISDSNKDYVILDIDLKSCYTSVLLGLFPSEMFSIRQALEGPGLWKYIEQEFIRSNRQSLFNKPAVKICVYSSFFCGGPKAMVNGTLDFMRKEIGLTPQEFRNVEYYEALHALARDVSSFMNSTDVIQNFRDISRLISKDYDGQFIKGPTSHEFKIDTHQFQTSYPNFLQSFEFYLLAQSTLNTLPHFDAHLIHHFHDGNVIYLPRSQVEDYITSINSSLEELRNDLGLAYPQTIEYKSI